MSGASIHLYRSNRTEVLADALADLLLAKPLGGPLDPEWIVVGGRGMAVWLAMQLASHLGVWAGDTFVYPRNFVERVFQHVLGSSDSSLSAQGLSGGSGEAFDRERLGWAVAAVLPTLLERAELDALGRYVGDDPERERLVALSFRVADTFDQYLTYRPDMLREWEAGHDTSARELGEPWQPILWRALVERLGRGHVASRENELLEALSRPGAGAGLPKRVCLFGLASLPPMYVRIALMLARHIEVHVFLPTPAAGYWEDLASPARIARARAAGIEPDAQHLEAGNSLLTSLGKLRADFGDVLSRELEALGVSEHEPLGELFREPDTSTRLGRVQADILHMRQSSHGEVEADASISLHACHGPMREVEVLHDQLLGLLTRGGDLVPGDVVVMMSDVDTYAPLVEAVFERDPSDERFIPYAIADRAMRMGSPVLDGLHRILALVRGRASASDLLDVLALEPVQRKLGVTPGDVEIMTRWVVESGVRWGVDAMHRGAHGQPESHHHTWRFGLERILLGYAMGGDGKTLVAGTLPYEGAEEQHRSVLAKLAGFCAQIFDVVEHMRKPRSLPAWQGDLLAVSDAFLSGGPSGTREHLRIAEALDRLCQAATLAGMVDPVGLSVVCRLLDEVIDERTGSRGFLRGGVTFSAMVPMRAIPFRVVCLLGMSDGTFPRARRSTELDLIAKGAPRPGDRTRRDDDRYMFLEALLSARDRLIITYTGQSIRDNSTLPPSVVVSDLVDYLRASQPGPLTVRHPLQPFSPRYFDRSDPALFSHSRELAVAATSVARADKREPAPLFDAPLPPEQIDRAVGFSPGSRVLPLAELLRFWSAPVRYVMQRRLGVRIAETAMEVPDREPMQLDPLERYQARDHLLSLRMAGVERDEAMAVVRAAGELVAGEVGARDFDDFAESVEPIAALAKELCRGERRPSVPFDLHMPSGVVVTGELGGLWARGLVEYQAANVGGKHLLSLWLRHLALCAAGARADSSALVGRMAAGEISVFRLSYVHQPHAILDRLVELYAVGTCEPLLLFPRISFAYARTIRDGGDAQRARATALRKADTEWREELVRDPYARLLFESSPPSTLAGGLGRDRGFLGAGFEDLARQVFDPLLEHLVEEQ